MRNSAWPLPVAIALLTIGLLMPRPAPAVVILDSTWREEGGTRGREADGFGAHIRLAHEPQFRSLVALSYDEGTEWGSASGTWIGNDGSHGFVLTSAHNLDGVAIVDVLFRTDGGTVLRGDRAWVHPAYKAEGDHTGVDVAIVRLDRPVTDAGAAPVLYAGNAEKGRLVTFVGFGMRGIGSTGENERFHKGTDKAAAQGVVDEAVQLHRAPVRMADIGNYLSVFLPREDGGIENPIGGSRRPASRLAGLLGSGDSGGSAWMPLGEGWAIVGVNTSGDGNARYGDTSWFVRVSGVRPWIASVFPGARFAADPGPAPSATAPTPPVPQASVPQDAHPAAAAPSGGCVAGKRFFILSEGAWYPGRAVGPARRSGACQVHYDGYSADDDEAVGPDRLIPWNANGPGVPVTGCRPGEAVLAEEEGVWYRATIRTAAGKGCAVRYEGGKYEDESLPFGRLQSPR